MKKAIFSIIISLILVLTVTGCSNSSKEKPIKKSALEINPTSKAVNITINKKKITNLKKLGKCIDIKITMQKKLLMTVLKRY